MKTRIIKTEETYPLRQLVLRTGLPLETCYFRDDENTSTFHIAIEDNGIIKCIASFYQVQPNEVQATTPYQLRGMATHPSSQKQGLGAQLIKFSIEELKKRNCDVLWCNARVSAQKFYEKMGFVCHGEVFDIPTVGAHIVMYLKVF